MATVGDLMVKIGADIKDFDQKMGTVKTRLSGLQGVAKKTAIGIGKLALGIGAAGLGAAIAIAIRLLPDFISNLQDATASATQLGKAIQKSFKMPELKKFEFDAKIVADRIAEIDAQFAKMAGGSDALGKLFATGAQHLGAEGILATLAREGAKGLRLLDQASIDAVTSLAAERKALRDVTREVDAANKAHDTLARAGLQQVTKGARNATAAFGDFNAELLDDEELKDLGDRLVTQMDRFKAAITEAAEFIPDILDDETLHDLGTALETDISRIQSLLTSISDPLDGTISRIFTLSDGIGQLVFNVLDFGNAWKNVGELFQSVGMTILNVLKNIIAQAIATKVAVALLGKTLSGLQQSSGGGGNTISALGAAAGTAIGGPVGGIIGGGITSFFSSTAASAGQAAFQSQSIAVKWDGRDLLLGLERAKMEQDRLR